MDLERVYRTAVASAGIFGGACAVSVSVEGPALPLMLLHVELWQEDSNVTCQRKGENANIYMRSTCFYL